LCLPYEENSCDGKEVDTCEDIGVCFVNGEACMLLSEIRECSDIETNNNNYCNYGRKNFIELFV
jgi:hypothetical protein